MSKSNKQNNEVLELDAEEVPLEVVINKELQKNNVTDQVIAALKEKFGSMTLRSLDDKESYLEIKKSKLEVARVRILAEKITKKGREAAIAIQRLWLTKEKEVVGKIDEVESHLAREMKKFEDEVSRKEREEIQRKENAYMSRQTALVKLGANYANGCMILGEISYDTDTLKQADDDIWEETILPKYRRLYEKNEEARIAEDKRRDEYAAKLREEQEQLEKERVELKKQQDALAESKRETERLIREQQREADEKRERESRERMNARYTQLMALGMVFNGRYNCYAYEDVNVDNITEINLLNDVEWDALIKKITPVIEERKEQAEKRRLEKIEEDKKAFAEEAVRKEKERAENDRKQLEQKRLRDEAAEVERLEQASDRTKWLNLIEYLKAAPNFGMKSPTYRNKAETANNYLKKIIDL